MKQFLIYTNKSKDQDLAMTDRIREFLRKRGQNVSVLAREAEWKMAGGQDAAADSLFSQVDCLIVLGGDGTVLQAARETQKFQIPIIGVNLGTLGYLTEVEPANLENAMERLIRDDYLKESRMMLSGKVTFGDGGVQESDHALNDIVIARVGSIQMLELDIYVNGQLLHRYNADGIIVSTPTGSSGYSMSAGGPLVAPNAKLIMLTPICPHSLNHRSIVLAPEDVIEIEIPAGHAGKQQVVEANFDASHRVPMRTGDRIRIVRAEETTDFLRLNQVSFLEVLHKKFSE